MSRLTSLKESWKQLQQNPRINKLQQLLQRLLVLIIAGLIIYQLIGIGLRDVLFSLPSNPLFYLIFALLYMSLPVAEVFIYRQVWPIRIWDGLKAFLTKRVYNQEVVGYSGEFYLFLWGRKRLKISDKELFRNIRDNSILSSVTSNLVAVTLLSVLVYTGILDLSGVVENLGVLYIGAGVLVVLILVAVAVQFRSYIFSLPVHKAAVIFSIYLFRFLLHHAGMLLMWAVAIPGMSWSFWFTFLALFVVVNRIPFIPGKDLVFMWAGIEFARMLDVTMASVAAMLLVYSALKKITNLILYMLISYNSKEPVFKTDRSGSRK